MILSRFGLVLCLCLAGTVCLAPSSVRATDGPIAGIVPRPLSSALDAARDGEWEKAAQLASRDGPAAESYIEWVRLRSGRGTPQEVLDFLASHAHWPGLDYLRRQNEEAFVEADDGQVLEFFQNTSPQTGLGALRHARALDAAGEIGAAQAGIVLAWRTLDLDETTHDAFLQRYRSLLQPHHGARLSHAIWEDRTQDVRRMLRLVGGDQEKLAEARLALQDDNNNVDALIEAVPEALRDDPGLAYDRYVWRVRKNRNDDAKELLRSQSQIAGGLGFPEKWSNLRRSYARGEMRSGDPAVAYELASTHQLTEGGAFADLEFLSGYLLLRYLDDPVRALEHFNRLEAGVQTPISLGRAGYWRGRALEALNRPDDAMAAYREGARHQTSFYGLLAAEKANIPSDSSLSGQVEGPHWRDTALVDSDLREAVMLLRSAGLEYEAERFLKHMAETATMDELLALGRMVEEAGDPHLQVMLGKAAASRGVVIERHYYALHPLIEMELPVAQEMALAIARRESEFDPAVTSPVGARGLMQLMPRTALEMGRKVGDSDDVSGRLGYWAYNAKLGSAYLAQLAEEFDGNVMLVSVGYNAGPSRATRWSELFGDPRSGDVDPVDWVEHIPFRETRNYVQRVAESLPVYRARLGKVALPIPFSAELSGSTLSAFAPQGE